MGELEKQSAFARLKNNVRLQMTSEGLRIILNESEDSPAFFEPGSDKLLQKSASAGQGPTGAGPASAGPASTGAATSGGVAASASPGSYPSRPPPARASAPIVAAATSSTRRAPGTMARWSPEGTSPVEGPRQPRGPAPT